MKKVIVILLAMVMMGWGIALAEVTKFSKDNLEFGVEYNHASKDLKDVEILSVDVPAWLFNGNAVVVGQKFTLNQEVATIGYKLGDLLTPYVVLGMSQMDANLRLDANIPGLIAGTVLEIPYNRGDSAFTLGGGLKGDLIELPAKIKLGYDVRMTVFEDSSNNNVVVLPGIWGQEYAAKEELNYLEMNALLSASREFKLTKDGADRKYFQSITPMVGFKYTRIDIGAKTTADVMGAAVGIEQNVKGDLYSTVVGVGCKVTANIDVKATGSFGGDKGFGLAAIYRF